MADELENIHKEAIVGCYMYYCSIFSGRADENYKILQSG
jgi:hypothetical protein